MALSVRDPVFRRAERPRPAPTQPGPRADARRGGEGTAGRARSGGPAARDEVRVVRAEQRSSRPGLAAPDAGPQPSGVTLTTLAGRVRTPSGRLGTNDPEAVRARVQASYRAAGPQANAPVVPEAQTGQAAPLTPERRAQLDDFDRKLADQRAAERGRSDEEVRQVADAVRGRSALGPLTEAEQRYLVDKAAGRWLDPGKDVYDRNVNYTALDRLAQEGRADPALGRVVGDVYAARASATGAEDPATVDHTDRAVAATLATGAVFASGTPERARALVERLGPEKAAAFTAALALDPGESLRDGGSFAYGSSSSETERVVAGQLLLDGLAEGAPTAASKAAVDVAFATASGQAYDRGFGDLSGAMGRALAAHWYPSDAAKRAAESKRLGEVLGTRQGRELLANDELPLESRLQHLDLVKAHPEWDRRFFQQKDHAFDIPTVAFALAGPTAVQYERLRGDTPQNLPGTNLDNTVGFAMGFPPQNIPANETDAQREDRERAVAEGRYSYYQGEPASKVVDPVVRAIRDVGGPDARVTVLPVQYASKDTGAVQLSLFRVQDKNGGADRFVDNQGRTYKSFDDWKKNNQLPPGNMTYPVNGHLSEDVRIETKNTPKTVDTFGEHLTGVLDDVALVGGVIAGGAILVGSGGTLAPVVVGGAAAWGAYRGVDELNDRYQHGQSINPITDEGARSAWLGLGANALSLASLGATGVAGRLAATGSELAFSTATAASFLRVGAATLDAAVAGNAGYTLVTHWDELSTKDRANLALSVGFWGATAVGGRVTGAPEPLNARSVRDAILFKGLDPSVRSALSAELRQNPGAGERALADFALSERFRSLSPEQQRAALSKDVDSLLELSRAPAYAALGPAAQRAVVEGWSSMPSSTRTLLVEQLAQHPSGSAAQRSLAELAGTRGFGALPADEQALLLRYVGGRNAELSGPARGELDRVLTDPSFQGADAAAQRARLEAFVREQPGIQPVLGSDGAFGTARPFAISTGTPIGRFGFDSGTAPATRYDVTLDGHTVEVYVANRGPGANLHQASLNEVVDGLRRLPPEVARQVNQVRVDSGRSSGDAHWANVFGDPSFRSYMTADSARGVVNIHPTEHPQSADFFTGSLVHEVGHFRSQNAWGLDAANDPRWQPWREAIAHDRVAASSYAKNNAAEDFAETYKLYYQVVGTAREAELRALMPERFALLDRLATDAAGPR